MKSKQGSSKRQLQERNFEIVVNHITINEDQLLQVSRQSLEALKKVFGHNIKKYSGTFHHKPDNDHVHFLMMSEAPKTESAVKARIISSSSLQMSRMSSQAGRPARTQEQADKAWPADPLVIRFPVQVLL